MNSSAISNCAEANYYIDTTKGRVSAKKAARPTNGVPLLFIIVCIQFFCPDVLEYIDQAESLLQIIAIARYATSLLALFLFVKNEHDSPSFWLLFLYQATVIVAAAVNRDLYASYAFSCFTYIGFLAINIEMLYVYRRKVIDWYYWFFFVLMMANMLSELLYPDGMISGLYGDNRVWLLGVKNRVTLFAAVFCCCTMLRITHTGAWRIRRGDVLRLIVVAVSLVIVPSSTALIIMFLAIAYLAWANMRKSFSFPVKSMILLLCAFFIIVVVLGSGGPISGFIASFFGKTGSFSGRSAIWSMALDMIRQSPFGSGLDIAFNPWGNSTIFVYSAHNTILDIACRVGIIPAVLFLIACFSLCARLIHIKYGAVLSFFIFSSLVAGQMEAIQSNYALWLLFSFGLFLLWGEKKDISSEDWSVNDRAGINKR